MDSGRKRARRDAKPDTCSTKRLNAPSLGRRGCHRCSQSKGRNDHCCFLHVGYFRDDNDTSVLSCSPSPSRRNSMIGVLPAANEPPCVVAALCFPEREFTRRNPLPVVRLKRYRDASL